LVEIVGRTVVRNTFASGLGLNLSLDLAEVLLHLPEIVVRQHDRMPAVWFGGGHGPLWTIGLACQIGLPRARNLSPCHRDLPRIYPPASRMARRGAWGAPAGSGVGMTVRLESGRTLKRALRRACQLCSGRTGGTIPGMLPRVDSWRDCGREGRMRARCGPAGRCTNRTPRQPGQPDADFGQICVFLFRRKVSLLLPANLRSLFPRGTPIGRASAVGPVGGC